MINYEYILHNLILYNNSFQEVQQYSQIMSICIEDDIHIYDSHYYQ